VRRPQPSLSQIATWIRALAKAGNVSFTPHALDQAAADSFGIFDVRHVLEHCVVVEDKGGLKYRCEGRTLDGIAMSIIVRMRVIVEERRNVLVITVWKIGAK
jgi:hypothetical protein